MDSNLAQEAINAALTGDWQSAIEFNSKILKIAPGDIDALNRLARAYAESGNLVKAKIATKKVLKLDSLDPIANRCVEKWDNYKAHSSNAVTARVSPDIFIENLAKTKIVDLINLGVSDNFLNLDSGDSVKLIANMHRISVSSQDGKYIGRFPDDLAAKYIKIIKNGRSYDAVVKSTSKSQVKILMKFGS